MNKLLISLFTIGVVLFGSIPLFFYFFQFSPELTLPHLLPETLSYKNEDWGSFGSFLSGTSGAIFSFFGTLAVVWTLIEAHKSNERQINLLRSEQTFSQFNELLKILTDMLENKIYPRIYDTDTDFDKFKKYAYASIGIKFNAYMMRNPNEKKPEKFKDFAFIATFHDIVIEEYNKDLFNKEAAIYTVLQDRILNSDESTREALTAVLDARLNEHYYFFFNCHHLDGSINPRVVRMMKSSIPLSIPKELSHELKDPFS
jgi:hypothetical protein